MEKHICIDCTLIKNHPDCNAYMDYLVDNNFIHDVENLPYGILSFANDDYIGYVFNQLCVDKISVPDEHDNPTEVAVLVNMDCTRIELLINADGSESRAENRIARTALAKYLELIPFGKSDDYVVFHLGEVLRNAFWDNWGEHKLLSGLHYKVVDTPFHGDIIRNVLNNISIRRHDRQIEKVITEALGITRKQAKFDHVFYPDTKSADDADDNDETIYDTNFTYRSEGFTLTITADEKGHQKIEVQGYPTDTNKRVEIHDIHDLKSIIDREFFNIAPEESPKEEPEEAPKEEPEEAPKEEPETERDISVSITANITANTYINAYSKKANDIISRTENGEDWRVEFNEVATPEEIVGYYFHTYGISKALYWWKKDFEKTERTEFDVSVDRIFDSIFCPFCKQKKRMSFGSTEVSLQYQEDGKVNCYHKAEYTGTMDFPICPQCGSKLE